MSADFRWAMDIYWSNNKRRDGHCSTKAARTWQVVGGDPAAGGPRRWDLHRLDAPAAGELADPARRVHGAAFGDLQRGEVAQRLEEQRQFLRGAACTAARRVAAVSRTSPHRLGTQVGQVHVLEQVLQQSAADGHRLATGVGFGRIPIRT